jgi:coenzyme F420-dependent glucose-6-phosphate dehydrogenase
MPAEAPPILVATAGPVTAKRAGRTVDGLITEGAPPDRLAMLLSRFAEGAREAGRDPRTMPRVLRLHLSWAPTHEEALRNALTEWPNAGLRFGKSDIRSPHEIEQMARSVRAEDFDGTLLISADPDEHRARIQTFADLGFDRIYLHNVGRNQREFLEVFGRDVLPKVAA